MKTVKFNEMKDDLQAYWAKAGLEIKDPIRRNFLSDHITDE